jgi:hypothetical protein
MTSHAEGLSSSARSGDDREEREESYGPVSLTRYEKDDGRALILYSRRTSRETVEGRDAVNGPETVEGSEAVEEPEVAEGRDALEGRGTSEDRRT